MLRQIQQRMESCKFLLHTEKSKIVNLRGLSEKKYPKGFDFLGFTIQPRAYKGKFSTKSIPCICVSQKSKVENKHHAEVQNDEPSQKTQDFGRNCQGNQPSVKRNNQLLSQVLGR
jgi:hypothetical protein